MQIIEVAVINQSAIITDDQVKAVIPVLQKQVTEHFAPEWHICANLTFVPNTDVPQPSSWQLIIMNDSDVDGDLGYHDLAENNQPRGKVFARTCQKYNSPWSITASHELLEMLVNPFDTLFVEDLTDITPPGLSPTVYAHTYYQYEICDAFSSDDDAYTIDNVLVSNFVLPAWFRRFGLAANEQFDHLGKLTAPFSLPAKGLIQIYDTELKWLSSAAKPNPPPSPRDNTRKVPHSVHIRQNT